LGREHWHFAEANNPVIAYGLPWLKGIPLKRRKGKTDITLKPGEQRSITAQIGQFKTKLVVA
jgi:hypothetical protein